VLRVPSLSILGPSPPAAASAKNAPPVERGILARPRSHQDPGLRGWANHDDSTSVRGDSVKAPGPFGGAVGKTLRCGQWHTLRAGEAESGVIRLPSEKHCSARLDPEEVDRLLGQRSDHVATSQPLLRAVSKASSCPPGQPKGPAGLQPTARLLSLRMPVPWLPAPSRHGSAPRSRRG